MSKHRSIFAATAMAAICAFGVSLAHASPSDSSEAPDHVVQSSQNGTPYQSGGITTDDARSMRLHEQPYNLRMSFSEGRHNAYITGLRLAITDTAGRQVFTLDNAGPLTDVALPAGRYHVKADFGDVRRSGTVTVKDGKPVNLDLHWPKDETASS